MSEVKQVLTKTIGLTVKDYKIILTTPLKFYKGDDLTLYFEVGEFGANVVEDNDIYSPLFPEDAFLFVETSFFYLRIRYRREVRNMVKISLCMIVRD